ncbi:hypothetical protein CA13_12430 [Planctomycetes bacterium CA13]|uniref:Uncharacterized protein n=1 Tax=Novipirellula herctigrandis TaxID=2527986 RepID=A0A5C5YYS7_9BACT|nr:hypothetical protein CA13_12430 [Planctomycetes bacterium CA13]
MLHFDIMPICGTTFRHPWDTFAGQAIVFGKSITLIEVRLSQAKTGPDTAMTIQVLASIQAEMPPFNLETYKMFLSEANRVPFAEIRCQMHTEQMHTEQSDTSTCHDRARSKKRGKHVHASMKF